MKKNTITYIVIALLVIGGAYWAYRTFSSGQTAETGGVTVAGEDETIATPVDAATAQANEFIQILENVDQVTLSERSLLTNKMFQTGLQDFGKPIEDRPTGRSNPFAPVTGFELSPVKRATTSATST